MRIMHLADLHIGKTVNGFPLHEDQACILGQVIDCARREKPDAVVIAGDVYDKASPGLGAVGLYDAFLTALVELGRPVLVIAGNHDAPERIAFGSRIMVAGGVHVCGAFDGRVPSVVLRDAAGDVEFHLLPYVRPAAVEAYFPGRQIEGSQTAMEAILNTVRPAPGRRHVLVAHQFFVAAGESPERSASEVEPVGGLGGVDVRLLDGFAYVALGHLHGPQRVGRPSIRYAGSPLKYSFSECFQKKSICMVTLAADGSVDTALLPLTPLRDMRRIRGTFAQLTTPQVVSAGNPEDYLQVTLTDDSPMLDAIGRLRLVYPNIMELTYESARTQSAQDALAAITERPETSIEAMFAAFFLRQNSCAMSRAQEAIVRDTLTRMEEAQV